MKSPPTVSVIIPVYGRLGDLPRLLDCLKRQTVQPHEILLVDSSPSGLDAPPPGVRYLRNPTEAGLSGDYNLGAREATGDLLLLMQQDCVPATDTDLETNLTLMTPERVAVSSSVTLPEANWREYNFWGQALLARWVGTIRQGISGKFDLIRADIFRRIGGYDQATFSYAGEDMDLFLRLNREGEVYVAPTQIIHLHNQSKRTACRDLFKKYFQLAESFGALFRKWGLQLRTIPYASHFSHHITKYLYVVLPFAVVWPKVVIPLLFCATQLTNPEVWRIPSHRRWIFVLLNPLIFLTGAAGTAKGILTGRQRYSVNK